MINKTHIRIENHECSWLDWNNKVYKDAAKIFNTVRIGEYIDIDTHNINVLNMHSMAIHNMENFISVKLPKLEKTLMNNDKVIVIPNHLIRALISDTFNNCSKSILKDTRFKIVKSDEYAEYNIIDLKMENWIEYLNKTQYILLYKVKDGKVSDIKFVDLSYCDYYSSFNIVDGVIEVSELSDTLKEKYPDYDIVAVRNYYDNDIKLSQGDLYTASRKRISKLCKASVYATRFTWGSKYNPNHCNTIIFDLIKKSTNTKFPIINNNAPFLDTLLDKISNTGKVVIDKSTMINNKSVGLYNTILNPKVIKESLEDALINYDKVKEVNITLYRTSKDIVKLLIGLSKIGIKVNVIMEIRARLDEIKNIKYSKLLKKAGVNVVFYKTKIHSKLFYIKYKKKYMELSHAIVSTGNFNSSTYEKYSDIYCKFNSVKLYDIGICRAFKKLLNNSDVDDVKLFRFKETIHSELDKLINDSTNNPNRHYLLKLKCNGINDEEVSGKIEKLIETPNVTVVIVARSSIVYPLHSVGIFIQPIDTVLHHERFMMTLEVNDDGKEIVRSAYLMSGDLLYRNINNRIESIIQLDNDQAELLNVRMNRSIDILK